MGGSRDAISLMLKATNIEVMKPHLVRKIRNELGLTLEQFAAVSGLVSRQRVWAVENRRSEIGKKVVNRMVNHLASHGYSIAIDVDTRITLNGSKMKV